MKIETENLLIRPFQERDIDQYAPIVADPQVMRFLNGPQSRQVAMDYISEMIQHHASTGLGRYAVEQKADSTLIGFCGFRPAGRYVDFGYRYAKSSWGKGFGLEAALAVRQYGLDTLKMTNMEAGAVAENVGSIKILDKMEFRYREELIFNGQPAVRFRDINEEDLA